MNPIDIKELSFGSKLGICWAFFWRAMVITVGSGILGAVLGGVVGAIFGVVGIPLGLIKVVAGGLGLAVGLVSYYFYVRWLLASRLGGYRLALIEA